MNGHNKGPIPKRWLRCPRKAQHLILGKFLAFKTPLDRSYNNQVPVEYRFNPTMLFDACKTNKINIGLWIDLTNTSRFYNSREIENYGCKYLKLQCRGHGETPSPEQTKIFVEEVHNFISQNPLSSIGVHCTHGFNRTGFLLVSYLVENADLSLELALEMFAKERPPGIYKKDYIEELYSRYDDIADAPAAPKKPDWCFEDDDIQSSSSSNQHFESNSGSSKFHESEKPKGRRNNSIPKFMEGVPGVCLFTEQPKASKLQKKVQEMCNWKRKGFPGSQPVSMDCENMWNLKKKPYRVSWKADGTRYMMLIDGPGEVYFFDRDHNIFIVHGLRFPHKKDLQRHLKNTLIDGEMVIDKVEGEDIPRYLAYDIVKFEGQEVGQTPFYPTRLQCIMLEIINPRYQAIEHGLINKSLEPFSVRNKEFWDISQTASLLGEKFASALSHEPDGLIFQPSKDTYTPGRCDDVLKWKPLELNSVDFRLKIAKEEGVGIVSRNICHLYVGHADRPFAIMPYTKMLRDLDNKIVECKLENGQWKFMRERTDKSFPNSINTAKAVYESIQNPVTKENLLQLIESCKNVIDSQMMPPPAKRVCR